MVDLTKYLIFKATSKDYGVVEFDFNTFNLDTFSGVFAAGDYVVKTDEPNAAPVITDKTKLQERIKSLVKNITETKR